MCQGLHQVANSQLTQKHPADHALSPVIADILHMMPSKGNLRFDQGVRCSCFWLEKRVDQPHELETLSRDLSKAGALSSGKLLPPLPVPSPLPFLPVATAMGMFKSYDTCICKTVRASP